MVRRRKRGRALPGHAEEASGFASPVCIRRPSPEYSPMQRSRIRSLSSRHGAFSSGSDTSPSPPRDRKAKKHKRGDRRSASPSSSDDEGRSSRKKSSKKHKKKHKKKSKQRSPSPVSAAAAASAAASRIRKPSGGPQGGEGPRGADIDEPIVIFDRATRAFTAEAQTAKSGGPPGAPSSGQGPPLDLLNYRKAFGLSCGNYSFVSDAPAAAPAAATATAAAAGPSLGGGLVGFSVARESDKERQRDLRISHKTHPHLYWSCWKCSALNYKTRHQCIKCNRLYQR